MTRTLTGARARQLKRRLHRASLRNVKGSPAPRVEDTSARATRQAIGDLRNRAARLRNLAARVDDQIARLERRLAR